MDKTLYIGARCPVKLKEAIESLVPGKYITSSEFVLKAVKEKLEREGLVF